ncbi:ATP-binding protein [Mycoplasma sp. Mirounga ES2805-ORL]|uniref:DEAD/DEAH box helicase n=1 Tax=Mycoplasma sp. Mirounga ES2805-ORL TaxID=754514 RepID=UPI001F119C8A|nr:AAA domain-containing protein [Mycoplasma sp. Mirounga ES2805-ORL]
MKYNKLKNSIISAWIMTEYLSEANLEKNKSRQLKNIVNDNYNDNFYNYFKNEIKDHPNEKLILYFGIIKLNEIISILKLKQDDKDNIKYEDIDYTDKKFCISLEFDKDLILQKNNIFVSATFYILKKMDIPRNINTFKKFREDFIEYILPSDEKTNIEKNFNVSISNVLNLIDNLQSSIKRNLENQSSIEYSENDSFIIDNKFFFSDKTLNFNSFYIDDLETILSTKLNNKNIKNYLFGKQKGVKTINLDIEDHKNFKHFAKILNPEKFPIARFPNFPLSLMQQVAVNIAVDENNVPIKSVNGPPGTGKTTLLKDIFADLVTKQAKIIVDKYMHTNCNGILPREISNLNILVASSNNIAVKNIVKEIPLSKNIKKEYIEDSLEIDYFKELTSTIYEENDNEEKWGIFSLEGGKKSNRENINNAISQILDSEPKWKDKNISEQFNKKYNEIEKLKKKAKKYFKKSKTLNKHETKINDANWITKKCLGKRIKRIEKKRFCNLLLRFNNNYNKFHESKPFFDDVFRKKQSSLFALSLAIRRQFIEKNKKYIKKALNIWQNQNKYQDNKGEIENAWRWINFVIPVISTTFASAHSFFKNLGENSMGYLFIDEAGQALPYAGAGLIYRNKKIMALGDPFQIPPVMTLSESLISMIRNKFKINEKYLSHDSSVQTLMDATGKYGFFIDDENWIGIPLWVHRRCKRPMFDISNAISYHNKMVLPADKKDDYGFIKWIDVPSSIDQDKFVKAQSDKLISILKSPQFKDELNNIFVITPFKNVERKLKLSLKNILENKKIGTVHTFQGKEAKIVFLVLGASWESRGAANWAVNSGKPNLFNVAVTRAKEQFYIIGDQKLYKSLKSRVVDITIKKITDFEKKNVI